MKQFIPFIGLEIHLTLNTKTKLLSSSANGSNQIQSQPNRYANIFDLGTPGTLPVLNQQAINKVLLLGLALNSRANNKSVMSRKHYFYPDMPKNYQITQQAQQAILQGGYIPGSQRDYALHHIHLEEDAAKYHIKNTGLWLDYNRSGQPLAEIVTEPTFHNSEEVIDALQRLQEIAVLLQVSDCQMELGEFKVDVNISVSEDHHTISPNKCELKNLNSFKFIKKAIDLEIERQIQLINNKQVIVSSTLGYDDKHNRVYIMRAKESNKIYQGYIFITDANLPILNANKLTTESLKKQAHEFKHQYSILQTLDWTQRQHLSSNAILFRYFVNMLNYLSVEDSYKWLNMELRPIYNQTGYMRITDHELALVIQEYNNQRLTIEESRMIITTLNQSNAQSAQDLITQIQQQRSQNNAFVIELIDKLIQQEQDAIMSYKMGNKNIIGYLMGKIKKEFSHKYPHLVLDGLALHEQLKKYLSND